MPQLFSRMDDTNWLTPAIADVLDQGATPPGGDGSIRQYMLQIQDEMGQLATPVRIVNVRPTPSYTLYVARPDAVGRFGSRRTVSSNEIRRSVAKIADQHKDWTLGFLPQLQEEQDAVGILLRTDQHKPISLRRMLVQRGFREFASTFAYVLGGTIEQQLIVRDLTASGQLLILGSESAKQHLIRGVLLTLMLLNTPGELRLALVGQGSEVYKSLVELPHALGRLLALPTEGQRLLDGLLKEVHRRNQWFRDGEAANLEAHNARLREQGKPQLPRILMVIDSLSDTNWRAVQAQWEPTLTELARQGPQAGIYFIATADKPDDIPETLRNAVAVQVYMRSVSSVLGDRLKNFHSSLMRFVDAFVIDRGTDEDPLPIELSAVTEEEVVRAVTYWRQAAIQRKQESQLADVSGKTGVTGILPPVDAGEAPASLPTPPIPEKPSPDAIARATQALAGVQPEVGLQHAQALAAYLGWLGLGPLQDILGLSADDARNMLITLQTIGVLESTSSPTPRFIRLIGSTPPNAY